MPITQHNQPVHKLVCDNDDCVHGDWGSLNGWQTRDRVLCPADAAEARDRREQAENIAAAVADALTEDW